MDGKGSNRNETFIPGLYLRIFRLLQAALVQLIYVKPCSAVVNLQPLFSYVDHIPLLQTKSVVFGPEIVQLPNNPFLLLIDKHHTIEKFKQLLPLKIILLDYLAE